MGRRQRGATLSRPPLGVFPRGDGADVGVFSSVAESVTVCTFDSEGTEARHQLDHRTGDIHHGHVPHMGPGVLYGLRIDGPWNPPRGLRNNFAKLLIDPLAQALVGNVDWSGPLFAATEPGGSVIDTRDSAPAMPKSLVVDHSFDWGDDRPIRRSWHETVIYETHVKSLTKLHPGVPSHLRGTYAGMAAEPVVAHLVDLGVTAVELLPVQQFVHDQRLWALGLQNLWGYQPVAWCAPHNGYAAGSAPDAAVSELKGLVKALHAAEIEVILDVVFNHTAEIHHVGPHLSFRGIDNHSYYRLDPNDPAHYLNYSGTGNTVNAEHPAVVDLMVASLRGWVEHYHIDGFRFDLATTLGRRGLDVRFDSAAPLLEAIREDPVLAGTKLIAEPWDVGPGGYQLGNFPTDWSEWNDRYRQTVRDFWRGTPGLVDSLATCVMGSRDIFHRKHPTASINYVTSHDGFTLNDLVSYNERHNEANGEANHDGSPDNRSWNGGHEGPTEDPDVANNRERRRRSLLATLLLSEGVPMLLGGDELGRTQRGNNNAYAQDNDISWYRWDDVDREFLEFVRASIALRSSSPAFGSARWMIGHAPELGRADAAWYSTEGEIMSREEWESEHGHSVTLALYPADGWRRLEPVRLIFFNGGHQDATHVVPRLPHAPAAAWLRELDTSMGGPSPTVVVSGDTLEVPAHSLVVLRNADTGSP